MKRMVKQAAIIAMFVGFAMLVLGCATSYSRGLRALRNSDYELAIAEFTETYRLLRTTDTELRADTLRLRGRAYLRKGDFDRAISDFEAAQRLYASLPRPPMAGVTNILRNELAEARQQQQLARASTPAPTQPQLVQAHAPAPRQQQPAQAPATATVPGVGVAPVPAAAITPENVLWNGNASTWIEAVNGIRGGGNNRNHTIEITGNFPVIVTPATEFTFGNVTGITITITGNGTIFPSTNGSLLRIGPRQNLILNGNLTLQGRDNNDVRLVVVEGSTFRMEGNATVSGNHGGGGVRVSSHGWGGANFSRGTFIMQDNATVSGNTNTHRYDGGGGVLVSGTFIMQDNATVSGNINSGGGSSNGGGGVLASGEFTMRDNATVSGNINSGGGILLAQGGGGVFFIGDGTFTMQDNASVSGNNCGSGGGGGIRIGRFIQSRIYYDNNIGNFIMRDSATVSGNSTEGGGSGGGVSFSSRGTFTMQDSATVSGNTGGNWGGGISFCRQGIDRIFLDSNSRATYYFNRQNGTFIMQGNATVSDNTTLIGGGGVFLYEPGVTFTMRGNATISGNTSRRSGAHPAHGGSGGIGGSGGGGILFLSRGGTFTMQENATVSGNISNSSGGGMLFYLFGDRLNRATFTMQGGTISGNTADGQGGGMFLSVVEHWFGAFTMQNGIISGNTASGRGGGVFVNEGNFTKTGGTIHGSNDAVVSLRNTASRGHAIYQNRPHLWRNAAAGPAMNPGTFGFWLNEP